VTAAGRALHLLGAARGAGLPDHEIVRLHPAVLALVPPGIGPGTVELPSLDGPVTGLGGSAHDIADDDPAVLREALRLRARWVQELMARAAWEIGRRLAAARALPAADAVRLLALDEVTAMVAGSPAPADLGERIADAESARESTRGSATLPAAFRLRTDGSVVAVARRGASGDGTPAGGGRGEGVVAHGPGMPPEGAVLVVTTLDPGLAAALPRLAGLVAETGSPLSHLAILARELGVATVVGVADARTRFPEGAVVIVDGTSGEVVLADQSGQGAA
jgi:phosphohistidine swiveling domain-containing protein